MPKNLCWKKSLLFISKMLQLFFNTFTVHDKYFPLSCDKLTEPIQMQLSINQKTFSDLFLKFFKSNLNFKHFGSKD